jgi:hypothetical protein
MPSALFPYETTGNLTTWPFLILDAIFVICIGCLAAAATLLMIDDKKYAKASLIIFGVSVAAVLLDWFLIDTFRVAEETGWWRGALYAFSQPILVLSICLFINKAIFPMLDTKKRKRVLNWHFLWLFGVICSVLLIKLALSQYNYYP